jgi:hypothetical protein
MSSFWIKTNAMVLEECRGYSYTYGLSYITAHSDSSYSKPLYVGEQRLGLLL